MGRTEKNRKTYKPEPIQQIELSDKNVKLRIIAAVLFLIIGVGLLIYCFMNWMTPQTGWTEIEANRTVNNSSEYIFQYNLGASGISASAENRAVTLLYNETAEKAYQLFHDTESFEGVVNVSDINRTPNRELEIDEALYNAFEVFEACGSRYLYLAPIYKRYDNIFYCLDDSQLVDFDPLISDEVRDEYKRMALYANDPESVSLQLLGDNKIKLFVSEDYLKFAEEEGITDFIGFSWFKNAFEIDYIADTFIASGYTCGSFSSYDGFVRNMDGSGTDYSINIFDRHENTVYISSVMHYSSAKSIVYLRSFPLNSLDVQRFYQLDSGELRTSYLDIKDGIPRYSVDNLVSYSSDKGCGEILLEMLPVYISEEFSADTLTGLKDKGIYSIYCENFAVRYNDSELVLSDMYDNGNGIAYKKEIFE